MKTFPHTCIGDSCVQLSVIVPVSERFDDVQEIYSAYKRGVEATNLSYEFIYVLDGPYPSVLRDLQQLNDSGEHIKIIKFAKWFGEATALTVGFQHSSGPLILTLPAYYQIAPTEIPRLIESLGDQDMVVARRWPRRDSLINRLQSRAFHLPVRLLTDLNFHDLGCSARAFKRRVLEELQIYGDQHRFLPLLAFRQGFKVREAEIVQAPQDTKPRTYPFGTYLRRLLDILSIFFLLKFTKKPLRFFGLLGSSIFAIGGILSVQLFVERLFFGTPLADRPMLLLSSLLVVLGMQIFAIGLIGEIIIFTHAREIREYTIEEVIN